MNDKKKNIPAVTVNNVEIPIKVYRGERVVTLKEVDAVHERPEGTARKRFNDNKKRFIMGTDYFQVCASEIRTNKIMELSPKAHEDVTLITESGYLMLVKSFTDDLAWTVQRQLVNTYFQSTPEQRQKAAQQTKAQRAAKTPQELAAADKRATAMLLNAKNRAAANLQKLYDRAGVKPEYQALAISDFYTTDGVRLPRVALQGTKVTYDKGAIAEMVGIYSKASGGKKPHAQAVGAIIGELDITAEEMEAVPYCRNGHDGTDYQYTESVADKVREWAEENGWPTHIMIGGKSYGVIYKGER